MLISKLLLCKHHSSLFDHKHKKVKLISIEHENKMKQLDFSTMDSGRTGTNGEQGMMTPEEVNRVQQSHFTLYSYSILMQDRCKTKQNENSERWRKKESGVGEKGDVIVILNVIESAECACHQIFFFIRSRIHLKDSANCHLLPQHFHK